MVNPFTKVAELFKDTFHSPSASHNEIVHPPGAGDISIFDGSKFLGGLGAPTFMFTDFWSLRLHSAKLFKENLYARGLIRRLVTNEINTGLTLEAIPNISITGQGEDARNIWSEDVEARFQIWGKNKEICDHKKQNTFGALQRIARAEALVCGDVLVVLFQPRNTRLPSIRLVPGNLVQTPINAKPRKGHRIINGVELDAEGRQVAYWIIQNNGLGVAKRLPAFGERTGRRTAWLAYGTDKRVDEVRGEPMLSLILQSLKEIDRYRDSAQRKAVLNSILAMFIKKGTDKPGTLPWGGGAVRKDQAEVSDPDGATRKFNLDAHIPGLVFEELQEGEEPKAFESAATDINFQVFEAAIISAIAWANEMPPEILMQAFQNNYSASRAAVQEFNMYLNKSRSERAEEFDEPIYVQWLISQVLLGKIKAPGLLEAWRNPLQHDVFGAWTLSDWAGAIKPNVDLKKEVAGYKEMIAAGLITRTRAARELTGMKYSRVAKEQIKENKQLADALTPLLELEAKFGVEIVKKESASDDKVIEAAVEASEERTLELIEGGHNA